MKKSVVFKKGRLRNFIATCSEGTPKIDHKNLVYTMWNDSELKMKLLWEKGNRISFDVQIVSDRKDSVQDVWKKMAHYAVEAL